jgi:ParB family chromosome partitioning protein
MQSTFKHIPIEHLQAGRYQPRQTFDKSALDELAASIKTHGLIEPLIVRHVVGDRYEIIAGERRFRAACSIGLTTVPCLLGDYTDKQAAAVSLVENMQREDLNLIEEARAYQRLILEFHFSQDEIAQLIGKSRSHIANILRLLALETLVQKYIADRQISLGHARMLVGLSKAYQLTLAKRVIEEGLSVRHLEYAVRAHKTEPTESMTESSTHDADIRRLETQLAEHMGAPIHITQDATRGGWLNIQFFDNDTLTGLLERMGLRYD